MRKRKVLVKNEFDQVYTKAGGSGMNAYTTQDRTAYFITVPANKLETVDVDGIRTQSGHPVFREFYAERGCGVRGTADADGIHPRSAKF